MNELDIPCSDCGTELDERVADARELPVSSDWDGPVRIAVCPSCQARYYLCEAIDRLAAGRSEFARRGEM